MRRNIIGRMDVEDLIMGIIGLLLTGTGSIIMFALYNEATPVQFIITVVIHALLIGSFAILACNMTKLARSKK